VKGKRGEGAATQKTFVEKPSKAFGVNSKTFGVNSKTFGVKTFGLPRASRLTARRRIVPARTVPLLHTYMPPLYAASSCRLGVTRLAPQGAG
jgi:hypothetical protein